MTNEQKGQAGQSGKSDQKSGQKADPSQAGNKPGMQHPGQSQQKPSEKQR